VTAVDEEHALPAAAAGAAPGLGRMRGRRVLVIGGGQHDQGLDDPPTGNGRAISVLLAREGASVAVADIHAESAEATAQLVRAEGSTAAVLVGDASEEPDVGSFFSGAADALGGLDGVVLNVGIGAGFLLQGTTVKDWDRVMAVNARSHFLGCKLALATLGTGSVVLIGSVAASEVLPYPAYGASKAALQSLCRQTAVEGAPAIRCNLLVPGLIDTSLGRRASAASGLRDKVRIPARRQGTAWEVAYAALFLLSEESSYVTGQSLTVDGGLTVGPRA
jgi:NAD(P)-dependent dehydrogenase (short-subunit alcohol dehydrogenase family)